MYVTLPDKVLKLLGLPPIRMWLLPLQTCHSGLTMWCMLLLLLLLLAGLADPAGPALQVAQAVVRHAHVSSSGVCRGL
jgi:hypothetical protein